MIDWSYDLLTESEQAMLRRVRYSQVDGRSRVAEQVCVETASMSRTSWSD